MLRDENSGLNEKPVQMGRKNLKLLVGDLARKGVSAIRVATVHRTPAGTFAIDPKFAPPLLDFAANEYLVSIARRLVEILAAKSSLLSGNRRQKNLSLADFGTADIANFLAALHHQFRVSDLAASLRSTSRAPRGTLDGDAFPGR